MNITRLAFFKRCLKEQMYKDRRWVIRCFSINRGDVVDDHFVLNYTDNGVSFNTPDGVMMFSDYDFNPKDPIAPFHLKDKLILESGDLPNVKEKTETTYGQAIVNAILLVYPFGDKLDYMAGEIKVGKLEDLIQKRFENYPAEGKDRDPTKIYVDDYLRFQEAGQLLTAFTQISVPSASRKTMTHHPDMPKLRDKLIKQYEGRLHDPAVIAKIDQELVKLDSEWLKGDTSEGFYIKSKTKNIARKKMHGMFGGESAFGDSSNKTLIQRALYEGIDVDKMPELINAQREGSYDRGAETALGGEAVKRILQLMQNSKLTEDDCGSKLGITTIVNDANKSLMIGLNLIEGSKLTRITEDNIGSYLGKTVTYRTTFFCKTSRANFCKVCIGGRYENHPTALATAAAYPASIFMSLFMASMHGTALVTAKYDFKANMR